MASYRARACAFTDDVEKPSGDWCEYYYLLAVVLPERDKATAGLHRDYRVAGSSWSGLFESLHEHVTSYYHDSPGPGGEPRTSRMVIDSLTFDWLAECTTSTSSLRMARLMGGGLGGWCFFMEGRRPGSARQRCRDSGRMRCGGRTPRGAVRRRLSHCLGARR